MSTTYTGPLDRLEGGLDELAAIGPEFRSTGEKQQVLLGLSRFIARAQAELLRVLAAAGDVAEATGDRSTASWLATTTATPTAGYAATQPWRPRSTSGGPGPPPRSPPARPTWPRPG